MNRNDVIKIIDEVNKHSISKDAISIVNATISSNIPLKEKIATLNGVIKSRLCFTYLEGYAELCDIARLITPIRDELKDLEKTLTLNENV